ncbi:L-histidine N(alpha)-methyltransferase [Oscillatoria sp. FACHB-1406]|uniref:L-histidine N(alpha)-methyltransferase n=1 Tax=Oscillatoria sp. FACHB-1406 TaxID=2692846 RepID=UPI001686C6F6|nr:L-histidine N(alpha)-methyltransferase [Oscillatoria sp. FACHB-1406]MBD2578777.1 L-histidine N(alpha)-methyltransferase [Oscillatoria sp. FACHB-1406]
MSTPSATIEGNFSIYGDRLRVKHLAFSTAPDDGKDVIAGLIRSPKSLPPRYFYDERGSQLFEQICELPEYYPTRTEAAILQQISPEIARLTGACELVEFGSGSSSKTRRLLDAYRDCNYPLYYVPIDVSASILELSAQQLLLDYPMLKIQALVGTYEEAIAHLPVSHLPARLMFFLGSSLGNFTPTECDRFFEQISCALEPGDYFLLGTDLQKPKSVLEAAYNDSQGVTAAFNLNMLSHLNARFDGNFNLDLFSHRAIYNESKAQIEMYLDLKEACTVTLNALDFTISFEKGESILTEISRKFNLDLIQEELQKRNFEVLQTWTDPKQWFGLSLARLGDA